MTNSLQEQLSQEQSSTIRRVAAWNIFLDDRYPQGDRLETIMETLRGQGEFDAVAILEAQKTKDRHNGEVIARGVSGSTGSWYPHSRKSKGEHIGMFGPDIQSATSIDLGHKKRAVITRLGDVAIAVVHLRRQPKHFPPQPEQAEQTEVLLDYLSDEERAIIMGDFNSLRFQKPRRMIEKAGFESAFKQVNLPRVAFPTTEFREILKTRQRLGLALAGGAINIDDIYTRGVDVEAAGSFSGGADHRGVWVEYRE